MTETLLPHPAPPDHRLQVLRDYDVLDSAPEPEFDDLVKLASMICDTPVSVVNLVDADRQWFKAEVGLGVRETPLETSICARVMLEPDFIEVPDLQADQRFACNPLVTAGPMFRFYAGVPLLVPEGEVLGTLCVLGPSVKTLSPTQRHALKTLGRSVVGHLEVRRQRAQLEARRQAQLRASEELEQRIAEHHSILDKMLAGVVVHAADGSVAFNNAAASELLGLTTDQLLGRSPVDPAWHFLRENGSVLPHEEFPVALAMHTGQAATNLVVGVVRSPGAAPVWAFVNAYPEFDQAGVLQRVVVTFIDITERKRAQDLLRDADRRKDQFIATLAHELRNPLAPVSTAAQLLKSPNLQASRITWCADVIERQIRHMAVLLDDLLDISRITHGKLDLRIQPCDVQQMLSAASELATPLIHRKNHTLDLQLDPAPLSIQGDAVRLAQVVGNLLTNAAKYTDPGGTITLGSSHDANGLRIWVRDTGTGIDRSALDRIFEMFAQVPGGQARSEGGLGIGLALAKGLVTLHGGRIEARSEGLGHGSTFIVHLPATIFSAAPPPV